MNFLDKVNEGQSHIKAMYDDYEGDEFTSVKIFTSFLYLRSDIETGRYQHSLIIECLQSAPRCSCITAIVIVGFLHKTNYKQSEG